MKLIHHRLTFIILFHPKRIQSIGIGCDACMNPYHKLWISDYNLGITLKVHFEIVNLLLYIIIIICNVNYLFHTIQN
jgi:hypothetical protein